MAGAGLSGGFLRLNTNRTGQNGEVRAQDEKKLGGLAESVPRTLDYPRGGFSTG